MTQEERMSPEEERRVRTKFDVNATIAAAGQPMQKPKLNIVDELPSEDPEPVKEATWSKMVKPGMTVGEIKALIRQHGTAEEVAKLNEIEGRGEDKK